MTDSIYFKNNNLTNCFWGPVDHDAFLGELKSLIAPFGPYGAFAGDNLVVFGRNLGFMSDPDFMRAFTARIQPGRNYGLMWRIYMYCWACRTALNRDGDFVECGVSTGTWSTIMCNYLNFAAIPKTLYLYDAWATDARVPGEPYGLDSDTLNEVRQTFAPYPNVVLVPGFVPETFAQVCPDKIAMLHIDLNAAAAELAVLDHLIDRVVPGGLILFDDYGASGYALSQQVENEWARARNYLIAELPTGQGLLIK